MLLSPFQPCLLPGFHILVSAHDHEAVNRRDPGSEPMLIRFGLFHIA